MIDLVRLLYFLAWLTEAADTEKAVTYLLNNDVDTTVDMKMKGTSATEATVVTA